MMIAGVFVIEKRLLVSVTDGYLAHKERLAKNTFKKTKLGEMDEVAKLRKTKIAKPRETKFSELK